MNSGCPFCGEANDDTAIDVELNMRNGDFYAHQNHREYNHAGEPTHSERVSGKAHLKCYREWYESTYLSAFTITD